MRSLLLLLFNCCVHVLLGTKCDYRILLRCRSGRDDTRDQGKENTDQDQDDRCRNRQYRSQIHKTCKLMHDNVDRYQQYIRDDDTNHT